jgi:transcriptional regulator with XRE-family HTH domain
LSCGCRHGYRDGCPDGRRTSVARAALAARETPKQFATEVVMASQPDSGSTVRRILLGAQLRRLREASGLTREEAGDHIRGSESKMSRIELGRVSFKLRDVEDLLRLYGIEDEDEIAALLSLAKEANTRGWWHRYNDVLPNWFQTYVGLEGAASLIRTYEAHFVPGLLQTEAYVAAVTALGRPHAGPEEVERRINLRLTRQQLLRKPDAPPLWAVMDEAVLRRPIGGRAAMRGQVEHLITMSELPNVVLQILPFHTGGHAAEGGAFSILRFREPDIPDVVYVEQLTGSLYIDKRDEVDLYAEVMERVTVDALPPDRTVAALHRLLGEL